MATAGYGIPCQDPRAKDGLPAGREAESFSQGLHNCKRQRLQKKKGERGNKIETFTSDLVARSVAHKQTDKPSTHNPIGT